MPFFTNRIFPSSHFKFCVSFICRWSDPCIKNGLIPLINQHYSFDNDSNDSAKSIRDKLSMEFGSWVELLIKGDDRGKYSAVIPFVTLPMLALSYPITSAILDEAVEKSAGTIGVTRLTSQLNFLGRIPRYNIKFWKRYVESQMGEGGQYCIIPKTGDIFKLLQNKLKKIEKQRPQELFGSGTGGNTRIYSFNETLLQWVFFEDKNGVRYAFRNGFIQIKGRNTIQYIDVVDCLRLDD